MKHKNDEQNIKYMQSLIKWIFMFFYQVNNHINDISSIVVSGEFHHLGSQSSAEGYLRNVSIPLYVISNLTILGDGPLVRHFFAAKI